MDRLFRFLFENPILLVVVVAWIGGMVGNIVRAARKARERAEARTRPTPVAPPPPARPAPVARERLPERTAEDIAREMRRILGVEAEPMAGDRARSSAGEERQDAPPPAPVRRPRQVVEPERPPAPVVPTTSTRKLPIHVDPHVGEGIPARSLAPGGRVGAHEKGRELGNLGGRVQQAARRQVKSSRYALSDLKRAIVLNEILGPPLALRRAEREY